jgi:hypothetical protein
LENWHITWNGLLNRISDIAGQFQTELVIRGLYLRLKLKQE